MVLVFTIADVGILNCRISAVEPASGANGPISCPPATVGSRRTRAPERPQPRTVTTVFAAPTLGLKPSIFGVRQQVGASIGGMVAILSVPHGLGLFAGFRNTS
jgi:hypothetical protein